MKVREPNRSYSVKMSRGSNIPEGLFPERGKRFTGEGHINRNDLLMTTGTSYCSVTIIRVGLSITTE